MILEAAGVNEIINKNISSRINLFGAGKGLTDFINLFKDKLSNINLCKIIDNDSRKQGNNIAIDGKLYSVVSVTDFLLEATEKDVIIIDIYNCKDVYEQLNNISKLKNNKLYILNMIYSIESDIELYNKKRHINYEKSTTVIPKKIHYCWFGNNKMSDLNKKCIDSWGKMCPDYEIIQWNENNYDIQKNNYIRDAYMAKKWAFVSDYVRLDVVNREGGVYLDTDVEVVKSLNELLYFNAFCGFQTIGEVAFGLGYGSKPNNPIIKDLIDVYDNIMWDGGEKTCPEYQTEVLVKKGLKLNGEYQNLNDIVVLPAIYLAAKSVRTNRIFRAKETFCIHHWEGSWNRLGGTQDLYKKLWKSVNDGREVMVDV